MGPFLTGKDEYSPDLNKNKSIQKWLQEAGLATVLEALCEARELSIRRKLQATLLSLATTVYQIDVHLFVGEKELGRKIETVSYWTIMVPPSSHPTNYSNMLEYVENQLLHNQTDLFFF